MTKLIRGLYNLKPEQKGTVLTIGNFDGVHVGHQALLTKVKDKALALNMASALVTFEPLPKEFFGFKKTVPRLTRLREKFFVVQRMGMDNMLVLHFNQILAEVSAEDFVTKILCAKLNVKHIIIGDDFRFGRDRLGDFTFLQHAGKKYGFTVEAMPTVMIDSGRVSSTFVREALKKADHPLAEKLLGRPYTMQGRVVHGDKRGRILGFPTANIYLHRAASPVLGIYAVRMHGIDDKPLPGVANVGTRPTVGGTRILLEVHLFDFNREIYGKQVNVEFCQKFREEEKFENIDLMKEQIVKDVEWARRYFRGA